GIAAGADDPDRLARRLAAAGEIGQRIAAGEQLLGRGYRTGLNDVVGQRDGPLDKSASLKTARQPPRGRGEHLDVERPGDRLAGYIAAVRRQNDIDLVGRYGAGEKRQP